MDGKVIVEGGDVHPGAIGDGAGAQPFKPHLRDDIEGRLQQGRTPPAVLILGVEERAAPVVVGGIRHPWMI